jgi:hypothetical protein
MTIFLRPDVLIFERMIQVASTVFLSQSTGREHILGHGLQDALKVGHAQKYPGRQQDETEHKEAVPQPGDLADKGQREKHSRNSNYEDTRTGDHF